MPRKVKCKITGESGTTDTFYKAPDGRYYKTAEIYETYRQKIEVHKAVIHELMEALHYEQGMVFPTSLTRQLKIFDYYGDDVLLETIRQCTDAIDRALINKQFPNEYQKTSYIIAILKNRINDVYTDYTKRKQAERVAERKSEITASEESIPEPSDQKKKYTKNISKWIGADELLF